MIAHLRGRLMFKQPQQAIIEACGVGYDVVISVSTFAALPAEGADVALHIHTHVREDALALYGFLDRGEKRLFERLITVSGVGPKLAVTILSGLSAERLVAAIRGQDHGTLIMIPGVGKKLAERLVVELKDKLEDMAAAPVQREAGPWSEDVLSALVNLGYQRPVAQKAISSAVAKDKKIAENFEELFRAALAAMRS
jgi:holliday junction DNA helicase RuvA